MNQDQAFLTCPAREALYLHPDPSPIILLRDFLRDLGTPGWTGHMILPSHAKRASVWRSIVKYLGSIHQTFEPRKANWEIVFPHSEEFDWDGSLRLIVADSIESYDAHHGTRDPWQGWVDLNDWETSELFNKFSCIVGCQVRQIPLRVRCTATESTHCPGYAARQWVGDRYYTPYTRALITPKHALTLQQTIGEDFE